MLTAWRKYTETKVHRWWIWSEIFAYSRQQVSLCCVVHSFRYMGNRVLSQQVCKESRLWSNRATMFLLVYCVWATPLSQVMWSELWLILFFLYRHAMLWSIKEERLHMKAPPLDRRHINTDILYLSLFGFSSCCCHPTNLQCHQVSSLCWVRLFILYIYVYLCVWVDEKGVSLNRNSSIWVQIVIFTMWI